MTAETIHICDLCKHEIRPWYPNGNMMIGTIHGNYQSWPKLKNSEEIIEVCANCCKLLYTAMVLNIIDIDLEQIYKQAGFEKNEYDIWEKQ